jgi:hypothetical protein
VTSDLADEGKQCRCALIGTLTAGINVCAFQKEDLKIPGSEDVRPQPVLGWDYAEGVVDTVVSLTGSLLQNLSFDKVMDVQLLSCMLGLMATYATSLHKKLGEVLAGDALHKVDQWFGERGVLGLLFRSGILEKAFATFNERLLSLLAVCPTSAPNCPTYHLPPAPSKPAVFGQPTMSSADWDNMLWETRMGLAAGDLVCSVCVLLEGLTTLNKALLTKIHPLLTNASVLGCLRAFVSHSQQQCLSVFSSSWLHGMYHLVKVFTALITANEECAQRDVVTLYHCVAFHLLPTLPAGAEDQLMNLLQNVVFNPLYYWEFREDAKAELLESCAGRMSMRGSAASVTGKSNKTTAEILEDGAIHLTDIQTELTRTLKKICVSEAALNKSKIQSECRILGITSLLLPTTSPILPQDWMFLPVVHLYNASIERSNESLDSSPEVVSCVHRVLQFVLLLECLRPTAMECVKVTDKFARLMCVFLAGCQVQANEYYYQTCDCHTQFASSSGSVHIMFPFMEGIA